MYADLMDHSIAVFKTFSESPHGHKDMDAAVVAFDEGDLVGWAAVMGKLIELLAPFLLPDRDVKKDVNKLREQMELSLPCAGRR